MNKWGEFNRKYRMTPADWAEWQATKDDYKSFRCAKCGAFVSLLVAFLIVKGKVSCCAA